MLAVSTLLLGACGPHVEWDYDHQASFADRDTYAWSATGTADLEQADLNSDTATAMVREAIAESLAVRGFRQVDADQADLLVSFHLAMTRRIPSNQVNDVYLDRTGHRWYYRVGPSERDPLHPSDHGPIYDVGTLVLDFIDPQRDKPIWRGYAEDVLQPYASRDERRQRIDRVIDKLLAEFPPSASSGMEQDGEAF
jgi:hypothetical protein